MRLRFDEKITVSSDDDSLVVEACVEAFSSAVIMTLAQAKRFRKMLDTHIANVERHQSMERIRKAVAK